MSRKARHQHLFEKSKEAALAAISCYNQPNFSYREESFCILMINAWELLFKAKIVKNNKENLNSICVEDKNAKRKNGKPFAKIKYRKNKAGNYITISFKSILDKQDQFNLGIDVTLKEQLEILYLLRNDSTHFSISRLERNALEIFTATLQSYCLMCKTWFKQEVSDNLSLIPLAFDLPNSFNAEVNSKEAERLLAFIAEQEQKSRENKSEHSICVTVKLKFERSKKGISVNIGKEGECRIIIDSEDGFKNKYPWTYRDKLIPALKKYSNFKQGGEFNNVMQKLKADKKYCDERYLDWNKKQGTKKTFYSPNIIEELEKKLRLKKRGNL